MDKSHVHNNFKIEAGHFRRDTRGNFSLLLGAIALPVVMTMGVAADFSRQEKANVIIQDSLDTAALYVATMQTANAAQIETESEALFLANIKNRVDFDLRSFSFTQTENGLTLNVSGTIDPLFPKLSSRIELGARASSGVIDSAK